MGKVQYPEYKVHRPTPIFQRRDDLLHYELAFQFQSDILSCIEAGQWQVETPICMNKNCFNNSIIVFTREFDLQEFNSKYCQVIFVLVKILEIS